MRRPARFALALAIALATPAFAQDPVYTWVDAQGVRHYSQTPPDGVRYETLNVRDRAVGTEATEAPERTDASPTAAQDRVACDRARLSLEQLDSQVPLEMDKDGDGTMEPIDDAQRTQQRRLAEQAVRAFCVN